MKAAIVTAAGAQPTYGDFQNPVRHEGFEVITVTAAALTNLTKGRASGSHYSADNQYPFVPGVDGVGTLADGRRVYFAMPEAPFGAMAEQTLVDPRRVITLPDALDDVAAAALANPGMSCFAALVERARLQAGETVLINGATGAAGIVAIQVAKQLGARKVIVTGRNAKELGALLSLGADEIIPFDLRPENPQGVEHFEQALTTVFADGLDVVVDYLWGSSARTIIVAVAKAVEDAHPVRFVQVGGGQWRVFRITCCRITLLSHPDHGQWPEVGSTAQAAGGHPSDLRSGRARQALPSYKSRSAFDSHRKLGCFRQSPVGLHVEVTCIAGQAGLFADRLNLHWLSDCFPDDCSHLREAQCFRAGDWNTYTGILIRE